MTINYSCDSLFGCQTAASTTPPPHLPPQLSPGPTYCLLIARTWIICPETTPCFFLFRVASFAIKVSPCCRLWRSAFKRWQVSSLRKFGFMSLSICCKRKRLVSAGGSLRKASLQDNPPPPTHSDPQHYSHGCSSCNWQAYYPPRPPFLYS